MSLRPVALFSLLALALVGCEPVQPDLEDSWLDGLTESEVERTLEALADFDVPLDASPARMRREQRALERELVAILGVDRAADFPGFDADRREAIRSRQTSPRGLVATCGHDEVDDGREERDRAQRARQRGREARRSARHPLRSTLAGNG